MSRNVPWITSVIICTLMVAAVAIGEYRREAERSRLMQLCRDSGLPEFACEIHVQGVR